MGRARAFRTGICSFVPITVNEISMLKRKAVSEVKDMKEVEKRPKKMEELPSNVQAAYAAIFKHPYEAKEVSEELQGLLRSVWEEHKSLSFSTHNTAPFLLQAFISDKNSIAEFIVENAPTEVLRTALMDRVEIWTDLKWDGVTAIYFAAHANCVPVLEAYERVFGAIEEPVYLEVHTHEGVESSLCKAVRENDMFAFDSLAWFYDRHEISMAALRSYEGFDLAELFVRTVSKRLYGTNCLDANDRRFLQCIHFHGVDVSAALDWALVKMRDSLTRANVRKLQLYVEKLAKKKWKKESFVSLVTALMLNEKEYACLDVRALAAVKQFL